MSSKTYFFSTAVRSVTADSGGALDVFHARTEDIGGLIVRAALGDARAVALASALAAAIKASKRPAGTKAKLVCTACGLRLRRNAFAVAVAMPARDDAEQGVATAVCDKCSPVGTDPREVLAEAYKAIWPSLRTIVVTHPEGGRA